MTQLYIIQQGNTNKYKVGIANNPKTRLKGLQTGNADTLSLVKTFDILDSTDIECLIHNVLKEYRRNGEWFVTDLKNIEIVIEQILRENPPKTKIQTTAPKIEDITSPVVTTKNTGCLILTTIFIVIPFSFLGFLFYYLAIRSHGLELYFLTVLYMAFFLIGSMSILAVISTNNR